MDKLKKYIQENREAFDIHEPSANLWSRIEEDLPDSPKGKLVGFTPKRWLNWSAAASIVFLLGLGYLAGKYWRPISENNEIIGLSPKYGTEVIQYATFINEKKKKLKSYSAENPNLMKDFNQDLESLDSNFEKLKSDLPNNPNQEEILNRMIDNLEWQMQLLDTQLDILKEKKREDSTEEYVISDDFLFDESTEVPVRVV